MPNIIKIGSSNKKLSLTAKTTDVLTGKTFSVDGKDTLTGAMASRGAVNQTLAINGTYSIPAGYHNGSGKVTQSITTLGATTYTPKTTDQTIASGRYLSGVQTIKGDTNLVADNIKSGKSIFGVAGSLVENTTQVATGTFSTSTNSDDDKDVYYVSKSVGFAPDGVAVISLNEWTVGSSGDRVLLGMYYTTSLTGVQVYYVETTTSKTKIESVSSSTSTSSIYSPYFTLGLNSSGFTGRFGIERVSGNVGNRYGKGSYWYIAWKN